MKVSIPQIAFAPAHAKVLSTEEIETITTVGGDLFFSADPRLTRLPKNGGGVT